MGIFDKLKAKKSNTNNNNKNNGELKPVEVYTADAHFYSKPTGEVFGAFALTEGVITALPLNPREIYKVDNKEVVEWELCLVSTTEDKVIGTLEYYETLKKLRSYSIGEKDNHLIINPLTLSEQQELLK